MDKTSAVFTYSRVAFCDGLRFARRQSDIHPLCDEFMTPSHHHRCTAPGVSYVTPRSEKPLKCRADDNPGEPAKVLDDLHITLTL
jgi:hypothetical protein